MTAQGDIIESGASGDKVRAALISCGEAAALEAAMPPLCEGLIEDNPFFAPAALFPALKAYGDEKTRLACVWFGELRQIRHGQN